MSARLILVTGATGFIGQSVMRRLSQERDLEVIAVSQRGGPAGVVTADAVDLENGDAVKQWARRRIAPDRLEGIVHLAARVPATFDSESATSSSSRNLRMTENVVALARDYGGALVYGSSSSVYGWPPTTPVVEDGPTCPDNPYSAGKLGDEDLIAAASTRYGFTAASLRIAAPYGPGQQMRTVIHFFLNAALNGRDLNVYGSGTRVQDFTFVDDVAEACWLALTHRGIGAFNIAGGQPVSMRQLAELVVECTGVAGARIIVGSRPDPQEDYRGIFSIEKARRHLGFEPRISLREGLRRCAAKYRSTT